MAIGFLHNRKGITKLIGDAIAADVLLGKKFYSNDPKTQIIGAMPDNGTVSTDISAKATEVTIAAGKHSGSGKVKISATEQAKIIAGNIKSGITILGVAGNSNVVDTSAGDAVSSDMLNGKKAYVGGALVTGNIASKGAATYTPGTSNQTISAGQYLSGAQTIEGDADLVSANIKSGANIFGVAGKASVVDTADANAIASDIISGKIGYVNGVKITGTLNKYNVTAGEFYVGVSAGTVETNSSTPVKAKEIRVLKSGTYRVFFTLNGIPTTSFKGQIYKNGVAYGTERANVSQFYEQYYVEDLSFTANDYVQLYISSPSGYASSGGNLKVGINPGFSTSDIATIIT